MQKCFIALVATWRMRVLWSSISNSTFAFDEPVHRTCSSHPSVQAKYITTPTTRHASNGSISPQFSGLGGGLPVPTKCQPQTNGAQMVDGSCARFFCPCCTLGTLGPRSHARLKELVSFRLGLLRWKWGSEREYGRPIYRQ